MSMGVPGPAIPLLFASNEEVTAANASTLASVSQAQNAAAAAHHATLQAAALSSSNTGGAGTPGTGPGGAPAPLSSHGPMRFAQPGAPSYPMHPMTSLQQSPHNIQPQPRQALQSPTTPARASSIDGSVPPSTVGSIGHDVTPMQQQLQPAFAQGQPNSNSRFDVLNFERPQSSPDRYRPGHRATVSAVPAFAGDSPNSMANPTTPTQIGRGPPQHSPFYPPQLVPPPQMVSGPTGMMHAQIPQGSPPFTGQGSPVQGVPPGQVPFLSMTPSRPPPVRGRGHNASSSTSDLQIHQWKPKQATRDNRWKVVTNPFASRSKDKSASTEESAGPPPAKVQLQHGSSKAAPNSAADTGSDRQPSPSQRTPTSSTSVVAAQNSKRRGHARSRSSISALSHLSSHSRPTSPPSVSRHDEGVAVLANLASEQSKMRQENIKSESSDPPHPDNDQTRPKLPSLLHYLETQAKTTGQPPFPGGTAAPEVPRNPQDSRGQPHPGSGDPTEHEK